MSGLVRTKQRSMHNETSASETKKEEGNISQEVARYVFKLCFRLVVVAVVKKAFQLARPVTVWPQN